MTTMTGCRIPPDTARILRTLAKHAVDYVIIGDVAVQTHALELDTDAGGLDVHIDPPGAPGYTDLRARA